MKTFISALAAFYAIGTLASSFIESPIQDTLNESPVVVRGTIGKSEVQSLTLSDGSTPPFTFWEMKVSEVLKGNLKDSQIRIRQLGGERDGGGLSVSGAAEFSAGEEVVLMLETPGNEDLSSFPIRGLATGKYVIEKSNDGNEYLIGAGIAPDTEGKARLNLKEVRRLIAEAKTKPAPALTTAPPTGALLGERGNSIEDRDLKTEEPTIVEPAGIPTSRPLTSRLWVLVVGGAIGYWFYSRSRKRKR